MQPWLNHPNGFPCAPQTSSCPLLVGAGQCGLERAYLRSHLLLLSSPLCEPRCSTECTGILSNLQVITPNEKKVCSLGKAVFINSREWVNLFCYLVQKGELFEKKCNFNKETFFYLLWFKHKAHKYINNCFFFYLGTIFYWVDNLTHLTTIFRY